MESKLRDGATANNNVDSSLSETLDELLELILLASVVIHEVISILKKNGSLGLTLLHLD